MSVWLALLLAAFASHRATRLVIEDTVANRPRTWLAVRLPVKLSQLVVCAWCAGFWISGAAVGLVIVLGYVPVRALPLAWPAVASASVLLRSADR